MKNLTIVLLILLFIVVIILGPIAFIWALNTLFPMLAIPHTLETWTATLILTSLFTNPGRN